MKQILSVADFAMILNLVYEEIRKMEQPLVNYTGIPEREFEKYKKQHYEHLQKSSVYKSLIHIKQSLENLNIEVEVPDVEVKE